MFIPVLIVGKRPEQDEPTASLSAWVFIRRTQWVPAYPVFCWFGGGDGNGQPSRRL